MVSHYKDLIVWQKSMVFVEMVYRMTASFPESERYGLSSQMRRAAVSVPSNIAEGQARRTSAEFTQFLSIANGSLAELETQIIIAQKLGYTKDETVAELLSLHGEIMRMIRALKASLPANNPQHTKSRTSTSH